MARQAAEFVGRVVGLTCGGDRSDHCPRRTSGDRLAPAAWATLVDAGSRRLASGGSPRRLPGLRTSAHARRAGSAVWPRPKYLDHDQLPPGKLSTLTARARARTRRRGRSRLLRGRAPDDAGDAGVYRRVARRRSRMAAASSQTRVRRRLVGRARTLHSPGATTIPCLFGDRVFFRTVRAKLERGADGVADVGTGRRMGAGLVLAETFPRSHFVASTSSSLRSTRPGTAPRKRASPTARRSRWPRRRATRAVRRHLLLRLHPRHGRPRRGSLRHREHLAEDGTVFLVEPFALDDRSANLTDNPMAALLYTASSSYLHAQVVVAGGGARSRRPGRRGPAPRRFRGGRVPRVPASRRDAAEPHPRGKDLSRTGPVAANRHRPRSMSDACSGSPHRM